MLFRFHRSLLEESMKTLVEVNSLSELTSLITFYYPKVNSIMFTYNGTDDINNWTTYNVLISVYERSIFRKSNTEWFCIGQSNSNCF